MSDAWPALSIPERARLIAVGIDGSAAAASTVQYAIDLAAERRGHLLAVAAFRRTDVSADPGTVTVGRGHQAAAARIRRALSQVHVPPTVQVDELVAPGDPARVLAEVDAAADILVIGRHHAELLPRFISPAVASAVAARAVRPVIVVPPGWDHRGLTNGPIVVALDGETAADAVLAFAFGEAAYRKTSVWALHTVPAGLDVSGFAAERLDLWEILSGERQEHPDITVRMRLVPGDPAEQIVRLSTAAGLAVVGEPHRSGAGSWARSVARTVIDRTNCPLAIVPHTDGSI